VTSTTATSTTTSTTSPTGIVTPSPLQPPGVVAGCNKFHFVETGTTCKAILSQYSITEAQLYAWNSGVNADCSGLWSNVYVCVGVIGGGATSTTSSRISTTISGGISTPTPTQPGMINSCNKFHFVETGTTCKAILSQYSITEAQLYAWNSGVNADCSGLWSNVYVCVGVIGGGATSTTSSRISTTVSGGISTPTPTQPGMINSCDKFHFVTTGTSCNAILSQYSLSLPQFYAWNSGINADCSGLWAEVYVCVHAKTGVVSTTTTTTLRTTTTTGNGIATPTPTMPGMVGNCRRFYKVVSGDTCDAIVSKTGTSRANIIKWNPQVGSACAVWLDYYICVGL
jgi:LysM repeat protein